MYIPPLYCPFPSTISLYVTALEHHAITWAQLFHLVEGSDTYERFVAEQHWRLIARAYPTANFTSLALVADWNTWGFYLDDLGDTGDVGHDPEQMRRIFEGIQSVLQEDPIHLQGPLFEGLADIWQRIRSQSTYTWREQLRQTLAISFSSNLWEATNRAKGITPTQETYLRMRVFTGAWLTYLEFFELVEQMSLPHEIRHHPYLEAYLNAVNNTIVWANDLMSVDKESAQGDSHNLVLIIQREEGCSLQDAIDRVVTYHNEEMRRCLTLEKRLSALGPSVQKDMQKYIGFAHSFIRANLDWAKESSRYKNATITLDTQLVPREVGRVVLPGGASPSSFWIGLFLGGCGGILTTTALNWLRSRRKQRNSL